MRALQKIPPYLRELNIQDLVLMVAKNYMSLSIVESPLLVCCQQSYLVGVGMKEVSLKDAQVAFQKIITWIKKSGKGIIEWQKTFYEVGMQHKKLKTLVKAYFVSKVIMFQETLEYVNAINICYT